MRYKELFTDYTKALAALPEKQRTVFLMARMEGLTYKEIAERLNLSVKAIEKRMSLTLAHLRKTLHEK
jgi:RNA polymerase sigma-70 factor (ECF subfamily)